MALEAKVARLELQEMVSWSVIGIIFERALQLTISTDRNMEPPPPFKGLSILDRFLVVWILLAMAIGIILANLVPETGPALQRGTFVGVSAPIAVGLLVMMYPILCKVRYETLHLLFKTRELWKQIAISFVLNRISRRSSCARARARARAGRTKGPAARGGAD